MPGHALTATSDFVLGGHLWCCKLEVCAVAHQKGILSSCLSKSRSAAMVLDVITMLFGLIGTVSEMLAGQ